MRSKDFCKDVFKDVCKDVFKDVYKRWVYQKMFCPEVSGRTACRYLETVKEQLLTREERLWIKKGTIIYLNTD